MIANLIIKFFQIYQTKGIFYPMMERIFISPNARSEIVGLKLFGDKKLLCMAENCIYIYNKFNQKLLCKTKNENNNNYLEIISETEFITYKDNSFIFYHYDENVDFDLIQCYQILRYDININNYLINNICYRKKKIICFGNNILFLNILSNYKIETQTIIKDNTYPETSFQGYFLNDKNAIIIKYISINTMIEFVDINYKLKIISVIMIGNNIKQFYFFKNLNNNDEFFIYNNSNIWKFSFKKGKLLKKITSNFIMREIFISNKSIYGVTTRSIFCKYNSSKHKFIKTNIINNGFYNFIAENDENIICAKNEEIYHLINSSIENILAEIAMLILNFFGNLLYFQYFADIEMELITYFLLFLFSPIFLVFIDFGKRNIFKKNLEERGRNDIFFIFIFLYWIIYKCMEINLSYLLIFIRLRFFNPLYKRNEEISESVPLLSSDIN